MNENNRIKAGEWYERAKHDLVSAELIIKAEGYADTALVLLQQAVEKYLKGYLISKGWKLVKTHNLKHLLDEAEKYNNQFERFGNLMDKITGYYIEIKYPFSRVVISLEEVKSDYRDAQEIIRIILEK